MYHQLLHLLQGGKGGEKGQMWDRITIFKENVPLRYMNVNGFNIFEVIDATWKFDES